MNKIDLLIMQKSKLFFQLEKKKGLQVNMAGLIFSEEESVNGWIDRSSKDIKMRKPKSFAELETWDQGHTYECFQNLDIEVINAEIKALHYSANLFYEKTEVKTKMNSIIQEFAVAKNYNLLKIGKLSATSTQKQGNYKLATEAESEVEHGFIENFMQLFSLRERLRKMRDEISEVGFAKAYPALMGNAVFNNTVQFKSAFHEKLMTPFIEELNQNDRRMGSKYMIQSMKSQINSLKIVMNYEYLKLVNVTLYKEVMAKYISPSASQFVLVALARAGMVIISKNLLEMIIAKREFLRKQREHTARQKKNDLEAKLKVMQKSTDQQLDDKISGKIDQNVSKTVTADLAPNAFKANKKCKKSKITSRSTDGGEKCCYYW